MVDTVKPPITATPNGRNRRKIKKDRELNDYYQVHKEKMTKPRKQ